MAIRVKIREDLHKIIDQVKDERILEAVYTLLERALNIDNDYEIPEAHKQILDQRIEKHERGETRFCSWEEAKAKIISKSTDGL